MYVFWGGKPLESKHPQEGNQSVGSCVLADMPKMVHSGIELSFRKASIEQAKSSFQLSVQYRNKSFVDCSGA